MNGDGKMKNFLRLLDTGQLTNDPSVKIPALFIRIIEASVIVAIMYGGFRVTFNNLRTDVLILKGTVGTSNNPETLCERMKQSEIQFNFIKESLVRIEGKLP